MEPFFVLYMTMEQFFENNNNNNNNKVILRSCVHKNGPKALSFGLLVINLLHHALVILIFVLLLKIYL
jgi:hypothetical protein